MTIKERSEKYFSGCFSMGQAEQKGYYDGAMQQRKLDIEKACNWLLNNYWSEASQKEFVEDFKRAMEED